MRFSSFWQKTPELTCSAGALSEVGQEDNTFRVCCITGVALNFL
jgi:hypothetical protein